MTTKRLIGYEFTRTEATDREVIGAAREIASDRASRGLSRVFDDRRTDTEKSEAEFWRLLAQLLEIAWHKTLTDTPLGARSSSVRKEGLNETQT